MRKTYLLAVRGKGRGEEKFYNLKEENFFHLHEKELAGGEKGSPIPQMKGKEGFVH